MRAKERNQERTVCIFSFCGVCRKIVLVFRCRAALSFPSPAFLNKAYNNATLLLKVWEKKSARQPEPLVALSGSYLSVRALLYMCASDLLFPSFLFVCLSVCCIPCSVFQPTRFCSKTNKTTTIKQFFIFVSYLAARLAEHMMWALFYYCSENVEL